MKKIICIALAALLVLSLFACGTKQNDPVTSPDGSTPVKDDDFSYIEGKKKIVIGITEYAPMNYYDDSGKLVGFDTEFAEAVCEKLGLTPEFIVIDWSSKETELKAKAIDCIWNGLTVLEERKENMAFTMPYLTNKQCVVIRAEDAGKYTDVASLSGVAVVAEDGSAGATAIEADLKDSKFTPVDAQSTALLEVKSKTADACVIDISMAKSMTGAGTDYADLMIVDAIEMMDEEYAIGFRLDSSAVAKFDSVIKEMLGDGTIEAIAEKYEITDLLIK